MPDFNRRQFLKFSLSGAILGLTGCSSWSIRSMAAARVVIIGGGFAGATAARYLRLFCPQLRITLIEPKRHYVCCPGSNRVLVDLTELETLTVDWSNLALSTEIERVYDSVNHIDAALRRIRLQSGQYLNYDKLIVAPGIDLQWNAIDGYSEAMSLNFPHAWQAGPQTALLRAQLHNLPDHGTVLICPPADPYRCPPGPYERATLIAWWLKRHKPRAKLLILDPKRSFSKQALFEHIWRQHYGYGTDAALLEWQCLADNPIVTLDSKTSTVISEFGDRFRGDVINLIPPQTASQLAIANGLTQASGWCPVDALTSESTLAANIHVIGDAAQFQPVPKSAFAANSQAKQCAMAIAHILQDNPPPTPVWFNTCYSHISDDQAISVSHVYRLDAKTTRSISAAKITGGLSSRTDLQTLMQEYRNGEAAYHHLLEDAFGSY